ncbi:MAG: adenosylcobinamide-GDP ribazoletransferase [Caldilineaceae bacterium]
MSSLFLALSFLTILPVPQVEFRPGALGQSARWFPLVGLLLGVILFTFHVAALYLFPPLLSATLTVTLWAVLTGGLHLDGLADCCDGLLAAVAPERRLEIMKDPRVGAFAAVGLVLFLLLKVSALASATDATAALLLAPALARWLLLLVTQQPMARPGGLGDEFGKNVANGTILQAAIVPLLIVLVFVSWQSILACGVAWLTTFLLIRAARKRLGGVTGDVFGLVVEVSELVVLLLFVVQG